MGIETTFKITVDRANKVDGAVMALEFWSSKGFEQHSSSHNKLVFRANDYGNIFKAISYTLFGSPGGYYSELPLEITMFIQPRPTKIIYTIKFELGIDGGDAGDFHDTMDIWINEFLDFINEWIHELP